MHLAGPLSMTLQLGILLALLCAFATNLAFFYKHRGACAAPRSTSRTRSQRGRSLWRSRGSRSACSSASAPGCSTSPRWALAPMSVVQAVARRRRRAAGRHGRAHVRLPGRPPPVDGPRPHDRRPRAARASRCRAPAHGAHSSYSLAAMISFEAGLFGVGGLLIVGPRAAGAHEKHHGVALGAASGVLFGVCDVAIKALTGLVGDGGIARRSSAPGPRSRSSPRPAPSTPRRAACRTARPSGHRHHRHRGHDLLHRRRDPRLRRPDARRPPSASSARRSPSCW